MTTRTVPAALILLAALLLTALPAVGQSYVAWKQEWESFVQKAPLRLGPLRLFPGFSLSNVGFDDNVSFESEPKADYTGVFSPELKAYLPIGSTILLSASENPEFAYFLRESSRRTLINSVGFGLKIRLLSRFVLTGQYKDYAHRRRMSPEVGALVTDRGETWDSGLYFETANETAIGFTAFRSDLSYEAFEIGAEGVPLSLAMNRSEQGGRAEFYYRAFYMGYLFLAVGQTEYRFQSPEMAWRNATARQASVGARFPIGGSIEGFFNLGYKQFQPRAEEQAVFSGLVGTADLSARVGRFAFRGRFGRDNAFSVYTDVLYFVQAFFGTGASFYLTNFLRLDYDFESGLSDYPDIAAAGPGGNAGRRDRRTSHSVGFVFRAFRTAGIGLVWNSALWTSTEPGWDRSRSFVGANLSYRF